VVLAIIDRAKAARSELNRKFEEGGIMAKTAVSKRLVFDVQSRRLLAHKGALYVK
jgi:hypothetical protein